MDSYRTLRISRLEELRGYKPVDQVYSGIEICREELRCYIADE